MTATPPPPTVAGPPLLDAEALARLRALDPGGRMGVLHRVMSTYVASIDRSLAQLQAAADGDDAEAVSRLAHTLKSSSASIGAMAMSRACSEVERRLRAGLPGSLHDDVQRLLAEGQAAREAAAAMLRD